METPSENPPKKKDGSGVSNMAPTESHPIFPAYEVEKLVEFAVTEFQSPLIAYASTILQNTDLARDVVQDTFIRLCEQDLTRIQKHLKSWLFTVCRNRAIDLLRKEARNQPMDDIGWKKVAGAGLQPDESVEANEQAHRLTQFLNRLTPNQREVILLKFQHGFSYQQIETITGLTSGNIGFLIHTGLKRLREIIPADFRS